MHWIKIVHFSEGNTDIFRAACANMYKPREKESTGSFNPHEKDHFAQPMKDLITS
jgi:hypothetical protein